MAQGVAVYRGRVAGVNSREYSFPDRQTGEKIEGVSHLVYIITDDSSEPVIELKATDEIAEAARGLQGKMAEVTAEPRARDSRVLWYATTLEPAST